MSSNNNNDRKRSSSNANTSSNNNNNKGNSQTWQQRRGPTAKDFATRSLESWPIGVHFKHLVDKYDFLPAHEWPLLDKAFRTPLPVTFRVTQGAPWRDEVLRAFQSAFATAGAGASVDATAGTAAIVDGQAHQLPHALPWSGGRVWATSVSKTQLKKVPGLKKLHGAMVALEAAGLITRQEAVSMVPPLFLDVRPEHAVLDMCASPGSKTSQILDDMHALHPAPSGFVVANDVDRKRAYLLSHQITRFVNVAALVTAHDAGQFPGLRVRLVNTTQRPLLYDRVLADVPCSGEGTIRKNGDVVDKWLPATAIGFHKVQIAIAKRGAQLLSVGGRLVYSTCSINPVENEAVVAELLRFGGGALELVDCSAEMPELLRRPGVKRWPVLGYGDEGYFDRKSDVPAGKRSLDVPDSCFAGDDGDALHLERCMRFYPHLQNTGGFFVAVIAKKRQLVDAVPASLAPASPRASLDAAVFATKGRHVRDRFNEDPFKPVLLRDDLVADLKAAFELSDESIALLQFREATFANKGSSNGKPKFIFGFSPQLAALSNSGEVFASLFTANAGAKIFELKKGRDKVQAYTILSSAATVLLYLLPPHRVVPISSELLSQLVSRRTASRATFGAALGADVKNGIVLKVTHALGRPLASPFGVAAHAGVDGVAISMEKGDLAAVRLVLAGIDMTIDHTQLTAPIRERAAGAGNDDEDDDEDDDDNDAANAAGANDDDADQDNGQGKLRKTGDE